MMPQPLTLQAEQIAHSIERIAHHAMLAVVQFAREMDLSLPQINLLFYIYHQGPTDLSSLTRAMMVTKGAVSQMVERLVQLGLVDRCEMAQDRRVKQVTLTPEGKALIQQGIEVRRGWLSQAVASLSIEEQATVLASLSLILQTVQEQQPSPKESPM